MTNRVPMLEREGQVVHDLSLALRAQHEPTATATLQINRLTGTKDFDVCLSSFVLNYIIFHILTSRELSNFLFVNSSSNHKKRQVSLS